MASQFKKMRGYQDAFGRETVKRTFLMTPAEEPKQDRSAEGRDDRGSCKSNPHDPAPPLTDRNIDAIPTRIDLPAVRTPLPAFSTSMVNGISIDKESTWIIPVIPPPVDKSDPKQGSDATDYTSQLRRLVKSSGAYALASLVSPFISLVLAPFLTHNLSRADYGLLAVLNTTMALVAGVTQLGLSSAFFRSYNYDYESQHDRFGVLSTVVILLSLTSLLTIVAIVIAAPWLMVLLTGSPYRSDLVRLTGLVILLQNLTVPGFAWLRAENRASFFSMLSIANLLATLSATIVLVGKMQMGIAGSLLATGIGSAIVVTCTLPIMLLRAGIHLRFDIARNLLAFGLPLILNVVSYWVLQLSDRYLLSLFGSLTQTASYAVAYSLGSAITIVAIGPFTLAWPTTMFAIAKRDDAAQIYRLVFRWFGLFLLFSAFGLSLVGTILLDWLFPLSYHSVAYIIPIIATSIVFYGVYYVFSVGVNIKRKTWLSSIFMTVAAIVNLILNLILIPLYGATGAAMSTFFAYGALILIAYVVNQRLYPIPFEIGIFISALLIGFALYVGGTLLAETQKTYVAWGIYVCALGLYGGCLIILGKLPALRKKYKAKIF